MHSLRRDERRRLAEARSGRDEQGPHRGTMQRCGTLPDKENGMELRIPDEIIQAAGLSEQELLQELALLLFQQDRLTLGYASRLAGIYQGDFMDLLAQRGIAMHYDVEDLADDLETLLEVGHQR